MMPPGTSSPVDTISYGIASVFTEPKHRCKGYATHMVRLLHYVLASPEHLPPFPAVWGAPPAVDGFRNARFSSLYSGVGPTFYAKALKGEGEGAEPGWIADRHLHRIWQVPAEHLDGEDQQEGWRWLSLEQVGMLADEVSEHLRVELKNRGDGTKTRLVILPRLYVECPVDMGGSPYLTLQR